MKETVITTYYHTHTILYIKCLVTLVCIPCHVRLDLRDLQLHCTQELFISRITKSVAKTSKLSRHKRRGWFTKEQMAKKLEWSSNLSLHIEKYIEIKLYIKMMYTCKLYIEINSVKTRTSEVIKQHLRFCIYMFGFWTLLFLTAPKHPADTALSQELHQECDRLLRKARQLSFGEDSGPQS